MYPGQGGENAFVLPQSRAGAMFGLAFARGFENRQQRDMMQRKMQQDQENENASLINTSLSTKDYLTGGVYDPVIIQKQSAMLKGATDFLKQNPTASKAQVMQMLNPYVNELATYKVKAQELDRNITQVVSELKGVKGINADRAASIIRREAMKSPSPDKIPSDIQSMQAILNNYNHELVMSDEGVSSVLKNQGKATISKEINKRDNSGRVTTEMVKYNLPTFAEIGDDGVPVVRGESFKIDKPVSGFTTKVNGQELNKDQKIAAQHFLRQVIADKDGNVKLLDENDFGNLMKDEGFRRNIAARTRAYMDEYEKNNGEKFPRGGVMEDMLEKAMAYNAASQYLETQHIEKERDYSPKITVVNTSSDDKKKEKQQQIDAETIDLWTDLSGSLQKVKGKYVNLGAGTKTVDPRATAEILSQVRSRIGDDKASASDFVMTWDDNGGVIQVYKRNNKTGGAGEWVTSVNKASLNVPVQVNVETRQNAQRQANQGNARPQQQQPQTVKAGTIVYGRDGSAVKLKKDVPLSEIQSAGFSLKK